MRTGPGWITISDALAAALPIIAAIGLLWFANMALTGWLAERRGREGGLWVVFATLLGPIALLALLAAPRKVRTNASAADLLATTFRSPIRLRNDSLLELDVEARVIALAGETSARVDGRPAFKLIRSAEWRWADGSEITDDDRARLRAAVPQIGSRNGWHLTLDAEDR